MTPMPVREIDGLDIFEVYDANGGPFRIQKQGRPDLVVIDSSDYEPAHSEADLDIVAEAIKRGAAECDCGNDLDARESLAMIRARYGL